MAMAAVLLQNCLAVAKDAWLPTTRNPVVEMKMWGEEGQMMQNRLHMGYNAHSQRVFDSRSKAGSNWKRIHAVGSGAKV